MGFNLAGSPKTVDVEEAGRRVTIPDERGVAYSYDEGGAKKDVTALVAGTYSKRFKKAKKVYDAKVKALGETATEEELDELQREMWAAVVIEWDLEIDGDPAVALIFELKPHVYDFIVDTSRTHAGFFIARSTN